MGEQQFRNVIVYIPETQVLVALQEGNTWWGWRMASDESVAEEAARGYYGWFGVLYAAGIMWSRQDGPVPEPEIMSGFFKKYRASSGNEECLKRHPGSKMVCMEGAGHRGKHRTRHGHEWEETPGVDRASVTLTRPWFVYDPLTEKLWRWNGPGKEFYEKGVFSAGISQAMKVLPDGIFVELRHPSVASGWQACYGASFVGETLVLRDQLVAEWQRYAKEDAATVLADPIRIYVPETQCVYARLSPGSFMPTHNRVRSAEEAIQRSDPAASVFEYTEYGEGRVLASCLNRKSGAADPGDALCEFRQWRRAGQHAPSAAPIASVAPPHPTTDPRPDPTGPCSFCELPAMRWCRDTAVCAEAECNAAEFFHVERLSAGSVDTPETRAEARRYAVIYLADKAEEDAQKKPEGSCAFCPAPAEPQNPECLVAMCAAHERAGWRLTHRLDLGGVSDTPQLRAEVLRHVAASDVFLEEKKRETTGARTHRDHYDQFQTKSYPSLTERQQERPPPEEIPLVGTTPHYEWP